MMSVASSNIQLQNVFFTLKGLNIILFQQHDEAPVDENKFDPQGYDKNLVENLERDIVQRNPNVHW